MKAAAFDYIKAQSVPEVLALMSKHGDYAIAGLAAVAQKTGQTLTACNFAFFSIATTPVLAKKAQAIVNGQILSTELIAAGVAMARSEIETMDDITNSAAAKTHLVGVLLERALKTMLAK